MTCEEFSPLLSPFVDGELNVEQGCEVMRHVEDCGGCHQRVQELRSMGMLLRALPAPPPPPDLALRLRVAASHYSVRATRVEIWKMRVATMLQAIAVPAVAGTMGALLVFAFLFGSITVPVSAARTSPDVPLGIATPPRLLQAAGFDVDGPLLVEANVDASGRVYGYRVLSGHPDAQVLSRLNNQLLFSVFEPATTMFGQRTAGSIVVSYGTVRVRG